MSENLIKLDDHDLQGIDINTIGNSCDGLFCLTNKKTNYQLEQEDVEIPCIYLWNPSIRIVKKLPESFSESPFTQKDCTPIRIMNSLCGVGFDTQNNDHKVIQIIYKISRGPNSTYDTMSRVYSMRPNSWRWLECNPPYDTVPLNAETFTSSINGSLYWIIPQCIMNFSFSNEIFQKITLPFDENTNTTESKGLCGTIVGSIEKSLTLFVQRDKSVCVWLMKGLSEGGIGSWTKKFTIKVENCKVWPINFGLDGKILLMRGFETILELWDLEKQTFEGFDIDEDDDVDVYTYSDSLVLLHQGST
ncbi:hypothetical protein FNV43_RR21369 [Rhamnella rubrinervis]|uniref:F-box associated beta-propeller type 3 domain-containing protein n=1 Tax=Rhamnella rubrinervis TaxID=2594499 RepID=A0A8K0DXR5_9ROSA|nr:hypothetical protein FNV43_RR21369 [Rhamnella rubrinervis]